MPPRLACALLLGVAACAPRAKAPEAAVPPAVTFTATDFAFRGPDSIAPGITTVRLTNQGTQEHHLIPGRLAEGKTVQDLLTFFQATPIAEPPFLSWRGVGGAILAGDTPRSTIDLPAGRDVLICFLPAQADQQPHAMKGMVRELVVAGPASTATAPAAGSEIRRADFSFTGRDLTAGRQTIHVVNDGPQTHAVQLVRLDDGATAESCLRAIAPRAIAPPPGRVLGGPSALSTGLDDYWTVDVGPGKYLFLCFVPETDGVPHLVKGMVREFTVVAT